MNTNLYEILKNVDATHRVKFTGWEMDFRDTDWPTMMEFSVKTTSVDASTNTLLYTLKKLMIVHLILTCLRYGIRNNMIYTTIFGFSLMILKLNLQLVMSDILIK